MNNESQQAWVPEDGNYAEESTLESYRTIKKLELLDFVFNALTATFSDVNCSPQNLAIGRFLVIKSQIENATTIEDLDSLRI